MYLNKGNFILRNCTLRGNTANTGGGMYNFNGQYLVESCTFNGNMSSLKGGAISNDSYLTVTNSVFIGNSAMSLDISTNFGGAILNSRIADFSNCEFNDNSSGYGGAFHTESSGETSLTNCEVKRNIGKVCGGASFNLLGSITSLNTMYCGNLPDHLVGGWVDDGGNELLDTCIPEEPEYCKHIKKVQDIYVVILITIRIAIFRFFRNTCI